MNFHNSPTPLIYTPLVLWRAADGNDLPTAVGVDTLSTGALIAIGLGVIVVVAVAILLLWCCCTGYIYEFIGVGGGRGGRGVRGVAGGGGGGVRSQAGFMAGSVDSNLEKVSTTSSTMQLKNGINYQVRWGAVGVLSSGLCSL